MRVVVTGAAGMIGSNLVHGLNAVGIDDVIAVDDLTRRCQVPQPGRRIDSATTSTATTSTGASCAANSAKFDVVLHQGACSDTMEHDGRLMLDSNYRCSKTLLDACQARGTRLLYASSAAVYGGSAAFREEPEFERPLNVYGYSKLLFDNVVRRQLPAAARAGRGLPLLQRLRPARAAQGPHGLGGVPQLRAVHDAGARSGCSAPTAATAPASSARLRARRRRRGRQPLVPGASARRAGSSTSAPGVRSRFNDVALRRRSTRCRALEARRRWRSPSWSRAELIEYIDFPAGAGRQVPVPHPGRPGRVARRRLRAAFADVATGVKRYVGWLAQSEKS